MGDTKLTVMFDTNVVWDKDWNIFYKYADIWKEISEIEYIKICIPKMVVQEIKRQKEKETEEEISNIVNSYYVKNFTSIKESDIEQIYRKKIHNLEKMAKSEISYELIKLSHTIDLVSKIKQMAISNTPPFDEKSDKGFKDTYIYLTILEYATNNPKEKIIFYTNDGRLSQAFKKLSCNNIEVKKFDKNKIMKEITDKITSIEEINI